jgi:hypothetical protein
MMGANSDMKNFLHWLPRILAVIFIAFISIFALDVVGDTKWYIALPMHLIPSFILTLLIIIAWKHERVGGILFLAAGLLAAIFFHTFLLFSPVFLIGILFFCGALGVK